MPESCLTSQCSPPFSATVSPDFEGLLSSTWSPSSRTSPEPIITVFSGTSNFCPPRYGLPSGEAVQCRAPGCLSEPSRTPGSDEAEGREGGDRTAEVAIALPGVPRGLADPTLLTLQSVAEFLDQICHLVPPATPPWPHRCLLVLLCPALGSLANLSEPPLLSRMFQLS